MNSQILFALNLPIFRHWLGQSQRWVAISSPLPKLAVAKHWVRGDGKGVAFMHLSRSGREHSKSHQQLDFFAI
jgi:hypothetical protein